MKKSTFAAAWNSCRRSAALCAFVVAATAAHADLSGKVVRILDGDTLEVLVDQTPIRVRLAEIDAPEKGQAFGTRSRQTLGDLAFGKEIRVVEQSRDRYGRTVGVVFLQNRSCPAADCGPLNVNASMISAGMAWAYRRYLTDKAYVALEEGAKRAGRGLWSDPAPVAPWEWRAARREAAE